MVVVRECTGTLRKADFNEREKMLQVYFPEQGKSNYIPPMFESKNLEVFFNRTFSKFKKYYNQYLLGVS